MARRTAADIGNILVAASDDLTEVFVIARKKADGKVITDDSGITVGQVRKMLEEFNLQVVMNGRAFVKKEKKKQKYTM